MAASIQYLIGLDKTTGVRPKQFHQSTSKVSSTSSSEEDISLTKGCASRSHSALASSHGSINDYRYIPQAEPRFLDQCDGDLATDHITTASSRVNVLKHSCQTSTKNNQVVSEPGIEIYNNEEAREQTFYEGWKYESIAPSKRLAKNGWFKTGRKDDVMCVQCRTIKRKWRENDSIIGSHKSDCKFRNDALQESFTRCPENVETTQNGSIDLAIKSILELGIYTEKEVQKAVRNLEHKGLFITTDTIMEEIMDDQSNNESYDKCDSFDDVDAEKEIQRDIPETQKMLKDSEHYKSRVTCKVCMDKAVRVLFLPCRHLICCQECADHLPTCPLCRATIVATIKAFV